MIGKLSGRLDSLYGNQLIIDVQGVGYVVAASARTLRQIGSPGTAASLLIETQVREDAINLYGFIDGEERDWFRLLTSVQGVGSKSALAILGILPPEQLTQAIAAQDKAALTRADGVGPKLALRIVTELKDKVATLGLTASLSGALPSPTLGTDKVGSDAVSALINLGYRRMEAFAAVSSAIATLGTGAKLDDLIRVSLGELSRKESAA